MSWKFWNKKPAPVESREIDVEVIPFTSKEVSVEVIPVDSKEISIKVLRDVDVSDSTLEDLEKEYRTTENELYSVREECARNGVSYEDMLDQTDDMVNKLTALYRSIRQKMEPEMDFTREYNGKRMTIKQFVNQVKNGRLTDISGTGLYATNKGVSNIKVYPSDVLERVYRDDFTHVMWFENKE